MLSLLATHLANPLAEAEERLLVAKLCLPGGSLRPAAVAPWKPPTPKVLANRIHRASSHDALVRRVEAIGARLAPNAGRPTGAERLSALAARVRAKSSPPSLCVGARVLCPEVTSNGLWEGPTQAASDGLGVPGVA